MYFSLTVAVRALAITTVALADCTADILSSAANTYLAAQESGSLADLNKLVSSTNFTYMENNKAASLSTGVLSKALKLDHNRTITDVVQCASYTELIATTGPYVIGTQIRHSDDGSSINMIDSIVATTGDWGFDAKSTLTHVSAEDWGLLPTEDRSPRDTLQAAADAYLDMWSNSSAINAVPWGTPCARTEGGAYTSPSCKAGAPTTGSPAQKVTMRRYVIDETVGSCNVLNSFAGSLPDSHEFRLISGKLRLVHTITV